jgi:hypothetical protein
MFENSASKLLLPDTLGLLPPETLNITRPE